MRLVLHSAGKFFLIVTLCCAGMRANAFEASQQVRSPRWRSFPIELVVSDSLFRQNTNIRGDFDGALQRALDKWSSVGIIEFSLSRSDLLNVSNSGVKGDSINLITSAATAENLKLFPKADRSPPATTRIFQYRGRSITEADIVLNPFVQFSTDGTYGTYDLETTLTHEIGHLLGLEHSPQLSSVMYASIAMNGSYATFDSSARDLSESDRAAIRSLYGSRSSEIDCCAGLIGTFDPLPGKPGFKATAWAEDAETGKVAAVGETNGKGELSIDGLESGNYKIFSQGSNSSELSSVLIGNYRLVPEKAPPTFVIPNPNLAGFSLNYVGLNGQVSRSPVSVRAGSTFRLYLGGKKIRSKELEVGFNSPFFKVIAGSRLTMEFANGVDVISVEVQVDGSAVPGEYSVFVGRSNGDRQYLVGGVSLRDSNGIVGISVV